jgi:sporulation protein YlmC with PRC-barrel domain
MQLTWIWFIILTQIKTFLIKKIVMKRSIKSLIGYSMGTPGGETGTVTDFYFDDETLTVRYLIVKTGYWWFERKVLIPSEAVAKLDYERQTFPVDMTKHQIRNSPDIDTDKPVSRQQEAELYKRLQWPDYWSPGAFSVGVWGLTGTIPLATKKGPGNKVDCTNDLNYDFHLRSTKELTGYHIYGTDDEVGIVEDFVIDDDIWQLNFLVIDPRNRLPGRKVLLSPTCITDINWASSTILADIAGKAIEQNPIYDPSASINILHEDLLYDKYGKPQN